jgi:hypothetical protein
MVLPSLVSDACIMEGDLPNVQLSALENMHYSYMVRFDNIEEAK